MVKKIISIAAVAVVLIAVLTVLWLNPFGRGGEDETPSVTTASGVGGEGETAPVTSGGMEPDDIPADTNFNQTKVTFLIWSDHTMLEFFVEDMTGNDINDAIYERNKVVEERLGVELEYVDTPGSSSHMGEFIKKAQTDLTSGICEYDIYGGYSRVAPALALEGQVAELTELDYLDFDKPWWPDSLINECMINNKLFFCSGDISTNLLWMTIATFFNKDLIADYGLENPYDLVHNNQWTVDKMIEMCSGRYNDLDGGGAKDEADNFGFSIYNINIDAFFTGAGFTALEKGADDKLRISEALTSQKIYDLLDRLGEFINTDDVFYKDGTSVRNIFFEERSIMTTDRVFIVAGKDNGGSDAKIEFEYGIIPQPKFDSAQENYSTNVGHPFTMYAISIGTKKTTESAAVLECLASESYRQVTPWVFESAMKIKYASDETTTEMYDILRNTVSFDLGRLYSAQVADVYATMRRVVMGNQKTFASQYKGLSKAMEKGIETISAAFEN